MCMVISSDKFAVSSVMGGRGGANYSDSDMLNIMVNASGLSSVW